MGVVRRAGGVAAEVTQALHIAKGGSHLAVGAVGMDVLRVFVELVAFGEQVGAHGVSVVEIKEVDDLRDDAEDACRGVVFLPGGGNARVVDGEQGDTVAVVAEISRRMLPSGRRQRQRGCAVQPHRM